MQFSSGVECISRPEITGHSGAYGFNEAEFTKDLPQWTCKLQSRGATTGKDWFDDKGVAKSSINGDRSRDARTMEIQNDF
jgi:hypothetical protein